MMNTAKAGMDIAAHAVGGDIKSATAVTDRLMHGVQSKLNSAAADTAVKVEEQIKEMVESDHDDSPRIIPLPQQLREVLRKHFDLDPSATFTYIQNTTGKTASWAGYASKVTGKGAVVTCWTGLPGLALLITSFATASISTIAHGVDAIMERSMAKYYDNFLETHCSKYLMNDFWGNKVFV